MTEEKRARFLAAVTVNVILLVVILAAVVIYQLVYISVLSNAIKDTDARVESLTEEREEAENYLEWLKSDAALQQAIQEQILNNSD